MNGTMFDPRAILPFLYDQSAMQLLQQQNHQASAFMSGRSNNAKNQSTKTSPSTTSSPTTVNSFRIHDLLEPASIKEDSSSPLFQNNAAAAAAASAMLAQMMSSNFAAHHHLQQHQQQQQQQQQYGHHGMSVSLTSGNTALDRANSSGENDSLLDDLDANQSSSSPRSSLGGSPVPDDSLSLTIDRDRASNCSTASAGGGPMHSSKKARKARTIFTDKQLQELETTFDRQKYLSVQDRVDLAHRMGLTDTQVKTWYQNRRTKWKRQAAVGVDLLQEASNMAAVQNLLRTSPYWSQFTRSFFNQDQFMRSMSGPGPQQAGGNPMGMPFPGMPFPPGLMSAAGMSAPFGPGGFPGMNQIHNPSNMQPPQNTSESAKTPTTPSESSKNEITVATVSSSPEVKSQREHGDDLDAKKEKS